ncbi:unnamed protein product [Cyclocybe aegerita]|uniref:Uncharacterized protein n=1 Tax=Cyclocybe aegerita TaxID=1973307 RepID=A0A8S0XGZ6_CYCAE|nr:unnamed protein product [Cyclocybe aegerita]
MPSPSKKAGVQHRRVPTTEFTVASSALLARGWTCVQSAHQRQKSCVTGRTEPNDSWENTPPSMSSITIPAMESPVVISPAFGMHSATTSCLPPLRSSKGESVWAKETETGEKAVMNVPPS